MYNDIIFLISQTDSINEYGDTIHTQTEKPVFAKVKSVGMKEKYQALSVGLAPELVFVIADYLDYADETRIRYNDTYYDVIRTYRSGIELEVVVSRGYSK